MLPRLGLCLHLGIGIRAVQLIEEVGLHVVSSFYSVLVGGACATGTALENTILLPLLFYGTALRPAAQAAFPLLRFFVHISEDPLKLVGVRRLFVDVRVLAIDFGDSAFANAVLLLNYLLLPRLPGLIPLLLVRFLLRGAIRSSDFPDCLRFFYLLLPGFIHLPLHALSQSVFLGGFTDLVKAPGRFRVY